MFGSGKIIGTAGLKRLDEYLDTLSSSKRALALYEKAGFVITERYNENRAADIFMVLKLDRK